MNSFTSDYMYSNMEQYNRFIVQFLEITSKPYSVVDIAECIIHLKTSNFVKILYEDPDNQEAISCIQKFLNDNPFINSNFLPTLQSVIKTKNRITNSFGTTKSITSKIIENNIHPSTKISKMSLDSICENLHTNIQSYPCYTNEERRIIPNTIKLKLNNELIENTISSVAYLEEVIIEGCRQNGKNCDSYINVLKN